nr:unnamed protein product [Spirometra erinaceieuropaei]
MPRRARAKRRKLAASPPSLGAKIVTEDMADASVTDFPCGSSQTSRNSAYTEGHRNPTLIRGYLSTFRHSARGSSPVFSHIFCAIGRPTLVLEILPTI